MPRGVLSWLETISQYEEARPFWITGGYNPLHFDAGLLHALVAMDVPGPGSVFLNQSWSFPKPVYIGDTILAEHTIISANNRRSIARMEFCVTNQEGDEAPRGEATVYQAQVSP